MAKTRGPRKTLIQRSREKGAAEKALYHQVEGAGKSKVKRPFLGLTAEDERDLRERLIQGMKTMQRNQVA
jgi:phage gpG-like protein